MPKNVYVARLLCIAFHGDPPTPKHHVAHDDGDPQNNTPKNVVWKTPKENSDDIERHGRRNKGQRNGQAKLTDAQAAMILVATGKQKDIGARFGVTQTT
ncbi:MAG: HNH endonuclease, partial [Hyphomicrobiales bacterium]|nr:HNH endonuclease [Hyphomicrobiales bacterium]MBV8662355.1 HNH endonuclease [Hyphomicrobiales bacterium]